MNFQFWTIIALTVVINTGMGIIVPILPNFLKEFGFSTAGLSLPFLSLILGRMIFKSLSVRIINAISNKITLVISFALYGLTFYLYSVVHTAEAFIALRFFEGVVEGISIICLTDQIIVLSKGRGNRGQMMGIFGSSFGIGFVLGPLIGGICYKLFGAAGMFYAGAILGIAGALAALLVPTINQSTRQIINESWVFSVMRHSKYLHAYGPSIIRRAVFFSFMLILPLYGKEILHIDAFSVALFFTASAVISSIFMPFTGKLSDTVSPDKILATSLLIMGILISCFGLIDNVALFAALFLIESLAFSFMLPAGMKVFGDAVDDHPERTTIVASFGALTEGVTLVIAVILPILYEINPSAAWVGIGSMCLLASYPFLIKLLSPTSATGVVSHVKWDK